MSCNHDCNQGRNCYCEQPRRLSYRGKVWLAYFATVAVAIRASDDRYEDLAARFGVSKSLIGRVRRGEVWRTFSTSPFSGLFA